MSIGQSAVTLCDWRVEAGMVHSTYRSGNQANSAFHPFELSSKLQLDVCYRS